MANILMVYSTTDGHTVKICERMQQVIETQGHKVVLSCIDAKPAVDPCSFDKIVIGASIRYGKHQPQVYAFIKANRKQLDSRPCAFFTVNVVARKQGKNQPENNPYMQKFLIQADWQPGELAVFAGKINYPAYTFWDSQVIRFIMWMTKGPTDRNAVVDFTDWQKVDDFGQVIAKM